MKSQEKWIAAVLLILHGCADNPYVLGTLTPPTPVLVPDDTLTVSMDTTGISRLPDTLEIDTESVEWTLEYRGQDASPERWSARAGPDLISDGAAAVGLATPFTDDTLAARPGLAEYAVHGLGLLDSQFFIESVFRSRSSGPIVAGSDWILSRVDSELRFSVGAATATAAIPVSDAWHYCALWANPRRIGLICNAQTASVARVGAGNFGDRLDIQGEADVAYVAAAVSTSGWSEAALVTASRRRFFSLTGVIPSNSELLPSPALRASAAYLDIERNGVRRLFPVGQHWPRVACRAGGCGFLSESTNLAGIFESEPSEWSSSGGTVNSNAAPFIDDTSRFDALVPSATAEAHTVALTHGLGPGRYAVSFFARAGTSGRIAFEIDSTGPVEFDLSTAAVLRAPTEALSTWAEDWGDGVVRCVYVRDFSGSEKTFFLTPLDSSGQEEISNPAQEPSHYVTGVQINVGRAAPLSLLVKNDETQAGDELSYPSFSRLPDSLSIRVPNVEPLVDVTVIALHETESERLRVFSSGQDGAVLFGDLVNPQAIWNGAWRSVFADFGPPIQLAVDDVVVSRADSFTPSASLAIDVANSRGATQLDGLVRRLRIDAEIP
ncbi:MAG: hypothetical protein AAF654_12555 [Myxococcota bacterium]